MAPSPTKQELEEARQLTDLRVNEISIVDRPAIQRDFLILKRDQLSKEVEMPKSHEEVIPWMRDMAKQAEGEVSEAILKAAAELEGITKEEEPVVTEKQKALTLEGEEVVKTAEPEVEVEAVEKAKDEPITEPETNPEPIAAVEKAEEVEADETIIKVDHDTGDVHLVAKGRKMMTETRSAALYEATHKMLSLLRETDTASFEKAFADFSIEAPKAAAPVAEPEVKKSAEEPVSKSDDALSAIQKSLETMGSRLEKIEKARAPSTSVDAEGSTDSTEQRVQKNIWHGML